MVRANHPWGVRSVIALGLIMPPSFARGRRRGDRMSTVLFTQLLHMLKSQMAPERRFSIVALTSAVGAATDMTRKTTQGSP
jgi:hypothetical protein